MVEILVWKWMRRRVWEEGERILECSQEGGVGTK